MEQINLTVRAFNLSEARTRILKALSRAKRGLSVKEIIAQVKFSERSVRSNLKYLLERKLVEREIKVTRNKRLAYTYRLARLKELKRVIHDKIKKRINEFRDLLAKAKAIE